MDGRRPCSIGVHCQAIDDAYGSSHDAERWWLPHGVGPPKSPATLRRSVSSRLRRRTATAAAVAHNAGPVGLNPGKLSEHWGGYGRQELLLQDRSDSQSASFPGPETMILTLLAVSSHHSNVSA